MGTLFRKRSTSSISRRAAILHALGVGRCAGIGGKPERGSGQTETHGPPFGVGAAADIAVAYEDDAHHPLPADLLELTISPSQVFEPRQRQAYEPAVSAKG